MSIKEIIQQLENNQQVFKSLLMSKKDGQYLWRPKPGKWNLLEIVCHLLDEERGDKLTHPELGDLSAKLFLTNWLAHDYLHIRQILRYDYDYLKQKTNLDLGYAGNW